MSHEKLAVGVGTYLVGSSTALEGKNREVLGGGEEGVGGGGGRKGVWSRRKAKQQPTPASLVLLIVLCTTSLLCVATVMALTKRGRASGRCLLLSRHNHISSLGHQTLHSLQSCPVKIVANKRWNQTCGGGLSKASLYSPKCQGLNQNLVHNKAKYQAPCLHSADLNCFARNLPIDVSYEL